MHAQYPNARIWVSTLLPGRVKGAHRPTSPRWFRGICVDEYNKIIRAAASDADNCYLVDMQAFGYDYDAIDGTHPTALGMKQMASMKGKGGKMPGLPGMGGGLGGLKGLGGLGGGLGGLFGGRR